jgi:Ca2+-binding EF-hand superfamily protein
MGIHTSKAERRKVKELFRKIDINRDGKIDRHEITIALRGLEVILVYSRPRSIS